MQQKKIRSYSRSSGSVTLSGDPVAALEASQRAWEKSYRADCLVEGLAVATARAGTEGVITNWECEATRMLERAAFLRDAF